VRHSKVARRHVRVGSSPCENAKTLDRDRTSYSFNAALAAQTASPFNFEIEPENIILVALRAFEFSHSLDPELTCGRWAWDHPSERPPQSLED
jgi:hypothetical protein